MLEAIDLTKRYEDGHLALDALNLRIEPGEIFFLLGANGAGKSTFLKVLSGEVTPSRGNVAFGPGERPGRGPFQSGGDTPSYRLCLRERHAVR